MPVQRDNRTTTWFLDQDDSSWTLARKVRITVTDQNGIVEAASNSDIIVNGHIKVTGAFYDGVRFMSSSSTLFVGEHGVVDARGGRFGVLAEGAGQPVENHGRILGNSAAGVSFTLWGTLKNYGTIESVTGVAFNDGNGSAKVVNHGQIEAQYGVVFAPGADSDLVNGRNGVIDAQSHGVIVGGNSHTEIFNRGTISGDTRAIFGVAGSDSQIDIVNLGRIVGDIELGDGPNIIDSFNGKIHGVIYGGGSSDLYMIAQSNLKIEEMQNGGFDQVRSMVSYRLPPEIELLLLAGNKDIDGRGNSGDNELYGNRGDNKLKGLNGDDELHGGRGNDVLTGNIGKDIFFFVGGNGRDVITDFEDGVDRISLHTVSSPGDFDQLRIRQSGDDTVIDLGKGNRILLSDFDSDKLDYADFFIA